MDAQKTNDIDLSCEERVSHSPLVEMVWRSHNDTAMPFTSVAQPLWGLVITKSNGNTTITLRGPETKASEAISPANAEFIGVLFKVGTLMPKFPARRLMDRADVNLPNGTGQSFWLNGSTWHYPDFDNMESFIKRLIREDLLVYDPIVADTLQGKPVHLSLRSTQRRFKEATGLTYGLLEQIKRARYATKLLKQGTSFLDTVYEAGYSDQPHLIRSLNRFIGLTPQQVITPDRQDALSLLFNTPPD